MRGAWKTCRSRRFRIAVLAVLIVILALIVIPVYRGRRQARAVNQLEAVGAVAIYDYQVRGIVSGRIVAQSAKVRPWFLSKVLGVDACHTVVGVTFGGVHYTDDGRTAVDINFDYSKVTDDMLAPLSDLPSVKQLYLSGCTAITDESMKHITQLRKLERLLVHGTAITDEGALQLMNMKDLKFVDLPNANVTREAADELKRALPEASINWSKPPRKKSK